jgi:diadenosine tetraphosphate (Ap4A) HIT family hydrolase
MCAIVDRSVGPVYAVYEDDELLVLLPRYVRAWGSVMVIPKPHATKYSDIDADLWSRANALALRAARVVETLLDPVRCYVASIGSNPGTHELLQSSKHLHLHVIPVEDPKTRPADIFSWTEGVWVGEPDEWERLLADYRATW